MSQLQSIVFLKEYGWDLQLANLYLKKHKIKPIKAVDKTQSNKYRFRIANPSNFKRFITKKTNYGINFIIGIK